MHFGTKLHPKTKTAIKERDESSASQIHLLVTMLYSLIELLYFSCNLTTSTHTYQEIFVPDMKIPLALIYA